MEKDYIKEFVDKYVNYDEIAITYNFRLEEYDFFDGELEKKDIDWVYYAKTDEDTCVDIIRSFAFKNKIDLTKLKDYEELLLCVIGEDLSPKYIEEALKEAQAYYKNGEVYVI